MRTMKILGGFLAAFLPGIQQTSAQERIALSLEKSIEIGLENSTVLHSSMMKVQASDAKSNEVSTARLPRIQLGGSYTRLSDVPPFDIGPFPPLINGKVTVSPALVNNYALRLSLQQPLFTGFRVQSSSDIAEYSAQAAERDYRRDRAELVYTIQNAYWNLFKAYEFKKVVEESIEQVKAHLNDVQNMYAQGLVTKNEVLKIDVQLSSTQLTQLDAQNTLRLATLALNNTIGTPLATEITLTSHIGQSERNYGDADALVRQAIDKRPELEGMEMRVKAGEAGVTLARSSWYPQVYLTGNYYYARPNQRIFPSQDQFRDTWEVSLTASLDLWNWGQTIYQTTEAQAQFEQAKDARRQLEDGIILEVTQNYLNYNASTERIAVAEKAVQQAEENYRITDEKFKAGLGLNADLLDAEVALLQVKWNHIQALVDHALAEARLQKAIGQPTPQGK